MPRLIAMEGPEKGSSFDLKEVNVLGRSPDNDIEVHDPTVSRHHARITAMGNQFSIEDMGSSNGTFVNSKRVKQTLLFHEDEIEICKCVFLFDAHDTIQIPGEMPVRIEAPSVMDTSRILNSIDAADHTLTDHFAEGVTPTPRDMQSLHDKLNTVFAISKAIGCILDINELLREIMNRVFKIFPQADRGFIMLRDTETGEFVPREVRKRSDDEEDLHISQTIINEVVSNCRSILSADAMDDSRFNQGESIVSFNVRSMMCAPLLCHDEILGIIHIDSKSLSGTFTQGDLDLLTGVGSQAAVAISNASMHERLLEQQRMEQDLRFAEEVQHSFLPSSVPDIKGYEFSVHYDSAYKVGGDFYDFLQLSDDLLGIVIGDVAGKGISAALQMAKLSSDVRFFASADCEPKELLKRMNDAFTERETYDSFVTFIYILLHASERKLTIANAGHPRPLIGSANDSQVRSINSSVNLPIGVMPDTVFEQEEVQLSEGDTVAIYTDGVIEAMNGTSEEYGSEKLEEALKKSSGTPGELLSAIIHDVTTFVGDARQHDDFTLVCFGPKKS